MRIVKWDEFKDMPSGTIYQDYSPHILGDLMILGSVGPVADFVSASLLPQAVDGESIHRPDIPFAVIMPSGFGRDGLFNHDTRQWLIWERPERARLAAWLLDPELALSQQNDDPHAIIDAECTG